MVRVLLLGVGQFGRSWAEAVIPAEYFAQYKDCDEDDQDAGDAVRDHDPFRENSGEGIRISAC